MNLQTYLSNAAAAARKSKFDQSDQVSLGEMIAKLEPIVAKQNSILEKFQHEATVVYDFEYLYPTEINSWRGSYGELALDFAIDDSKKEMTVTEFLEMLKGCIGKTFEGYKGGDFVMGKTTPVWVARWGNSGNTAVIDVIDNEYNVIIMTGYRGF